MSYWKVPITTECLTWPITTRIVFCEIMLRASNTDRVLEPFRHGNKLYRNVALRRGQSILKVSKMARELGIDKKHINMDINRLVEMDIIMDIKRMPFGLVVTIKNYDELLKMDINMDINPDAKRTSKRTSYNKSGITRVNTYPEETKSIPTAEGVELPAPRPSNHRAEKDRIILAYATAQNYTFNNPAEYSAFYRRNVSAADGLIVYPFDEITLTMAALELKPNRNYAWTLETVCKKILDVRKSKAEVVKNSKVKKFWEELQKCKS